MTRIPATTRALTKARPCFAPTPTPAPFPLVNAQGKPWWQVREESGRTAPGKGLAKDE